MLAGVVSSCLSAELLGDSETGSSITGSRMKHRRKCVGLTTLQLVYTAGHF